MSPVFTPGGGAPSGSAGRDLGGSYPNPTVDEGIDKPRYHTYIAWTHNPGDGSSVIVLPKGQLILSKIWLPKSVTFSAIDMIVSATGGTALSNCFVELYDSTGTPITGAVTADQSTPWLTTGLKSMAVTGGATTITVTDGVDTFIWAGVLVGNGSTTAPTFIRRVSADAVAANANLSAANSDTGSSGSALTALPASFTPSAISWSIGWKVWVALK